MRRSYIMALGRGTAVKPTDEKESMPSSFGFPSRVIVIVILLRLLSFIKLIKTDLVIGIGHDN